MFLVEATNSSLSFTGSQHAIFWAGSNHGWQRIDCEETHDLIDFVRKLVINAVSIGELAVTDLDLMFESAATVFLKVGDIVAAQAVSGNS